MKKNIFLIIAVLHVFLYSCQKEVLHQQQNTSSLKNSAAKTNSSSVHISSAVATDWYKLQFRMMLNANPATNNALNSEAFAYMGIGLYESVRSGIKNSISLSKTLYQMPQIPEQDNNGYDLQVAANATLARLVRSFYPWLTADNKQSVDSLESAYNESLSISVESQKFQRSQEYGRKIAAIIYNWSTTDNYNVSNAAYTLPTSPVGVYIPTPPNFVKPVLPFVSFSRPFLIEDGSGVCPPPPFTYSEDPSSDFYKMVRDLYDVSKTLTPEQRTMALYWNDVGIGVGYTPAGHVMNVVTEAIEQNGVDLGIAAQAYAKAGIAAREAQLTCFRSKYQFLQMRPVSYIRKVIDPTWLPLIPTPTHPEYPAAHAYITTMVMTALSSVLGNDVGVVDHTYDFRGFAPRTFASLITVGEESGNSRRYGGIHYLPSIIVGLSEGKALGGRIGNIKLTE